MSSAPLNYTQPYATPEAELDALARIYSLAVQKFRETKEDVKESDDYGATKSSTG